MASDDDDDEKSRSEDDEDKSGSDEDGSGSDDNSDGSDKDDDDDESGSGSGSGSEEDDSDDKEDDSSDEEKGKKKDDKVVPSELQKPEENELKKLNLEIGSIQSEVDNFLCTLSVDTQNRIGFDPIQAQMNNISNRQNYSYLQASSPLNRNNYSENIPINNNNFNNNNNNNNNNFRPQLNQTNLPSRSPYNTYGQYRFQAEQQPAVNQELKNSGGFQKQGRKGSIEEVAEIQAMLGKQHNNNEDDRMSEKPKERFQLPKESQSIIDNYYQNLYRKKEPSSRNYSNVEDLYKQRQKTVYDEDEIRKKPTNNDQKYFRDSGMQATIPKLSQNQQKIDDAIRILLGKR